MKEEKRNKEGNDICQENDNMQVDIVHGGHETTLPIYEPLSIVPQEETEYNFRCRYFIGAFISGCQESPTKTRESFHCALFSKGSVVMNN